jgi:hypothetical protein
VVKEGKLEGENWDEVGGDRYTDKVQYCWPLAACRGISAIPAVILILLLLQYSYNYIPASIVLYLSIILYFSYYCNIYSGNYPYLAENQLLLHRFELYLLVFQLLL